MIDEARAQNLVHTGDPHSEVAEPHPPGTIEVPLLPLVESVVFPRSIYPLTLQGEQALRLVEAAQLEGGVVALFMQKELASDPPTASDLHPVGTLCRLSDIEVAQEGGISVTAQGVRRVELAEVAQWDPYVRASVRLLDEPAGSNADIEPLIQQVKSLYMGLLANDPTAAEKIAPVLDETDHPSDLAFLIASTIPISPAARQAILETGEASARLLQVLALLAKAHEMSAIGQLAARSTPQGEAASAAAAQGLQAADPTSRGGQLDQATMDRLEIAGTLQRVSLPPEVARVAERELNRLGTLSPTSPDYNPTRGYLQWLADLPWQTDGEPAIDLDQARQVLDEEHYGLNDVKERILEYLAVRRLRQERSSQADSAGPESAAASREPVLCLVGPPGIGKTSLGRSIADALNRPFIRLSLGGVSDEAEIRGHRRTYLGALPGKIIQSLVRVGSNHPVIMLDEIDKLGASAKGDPASALLEVLDPEQQRGFVDHYLDVPFDLSCVFFIATANLLDSVSPALRDRLEVIQLSGYTEEEKVQIGMRHLVPVQMEGHALTGGDVTWEPEAILTIVRNYTREAGVRQMEREIATVCRRIATMVAHEDGPAGAPLVANSDFIGEVLGSPRFLPDQPEVTDQPGIVTGVVWTPVGGDIIHVEASMMPGSKTLTITGQLGEIMRESGQAALSFVRARAGRLGIDPQFFEHNDIHLHVPSGAVQKDGPSAGVTMAVALVSLLTKTPVSSDVAMTGEITLRGRVLPVGGIKEKILAARRAGIHRVIIPAQNSRDLEEVQAEILEELEVVLADNMDEVIEAAFPRSRKKQPAARRGYARRGRAESHPQIDSTPRAARARQK